MEWEVNVSLRVGGWAGSSDQVQIQSAFSYCNPPSVPPPLPRELPHQSLSGLATSTSLTHDLPSVTLNALPSPRGTTQFKLPQGPLKHESSLLSLCVCACTCVYLFVRQCVCTRLARFRAPVLEPGWISPSHFLSFSP